MAAVIMGHADHPLADLYARPELSEQPGVGTGYTSPSGRARWAHWLLGLTIAANAASLLALGSQRALLDRGPGQITLSEWQTSTARVGALALGELVLLAVTAIVFLRWLHRCFRNLQALHVGARFTPGWAVGYWFVPVLSLWRPKQIVSELWRATDTDPHGRSSASSLIPIWWGLWLVGNAVGWIAGRLPGATLAELKSRNGVFCLSHLISIAAAVCAYRLVTALTTRQEARAGR